MEIDSLHLALIVQGTIKRAKEGNPLAKETLDQWNRVNQEEGLPPMEEQLKAWVEQNRPKPSLYRAKDPVSHTTMVTRLNHPITEESLLDAMVLGLKANLELGWEPREELEWQLPSLSGIPNLPTLKELEKMDEAQMKEVAEQILREPGSPALTLMEWMRGQTVTPTSRPEPTEMTLGWLLSEVDMSLKR